MYSQLLRQHMGPVSSTMLDFGHTFCINGLFQFEMTLLVDALRTKRGTRFAELKLFAETWHSPQCHGQVAGKVFTAAREKRTDFSCGSAECLQLYPIIREYLQTRVADADLEDELRSYMSLCSILDGWKRLQACEVRSAAFDYGEWQAAIVDHHAFFVAAYGREEVKPKHHYALHFPALLRRFTHLQAAFVGERRLKLYKEEARSVTVSFGFEKAVILLQKNLTVTR